jgi:hypothetical protein
MPIRPENRHRYGTDWPEFSRQIRVDRAGGRCECEGECGSILHGTWVTLHRLGLEESPRCPNENGIHALNLTPRRVILTVAHLCHTPECRVHVKAMCQGCHLNYDREHHANTRAGRTAPVCPDARTETAP